MKEEIYIDSDGQKLRIENYSSGTKWYFNSKGQRHRLDGPAVEYADGSYYWYKNGEYHRIGGPAYYYPRFSYIEWLINGRIVEVYYIYG